MAERLGNAKIHAQLETRLNRIGGRENNSHVLAERSINFANDYEDMMDKVLVVFVVVIVAVVIIIILFSACYCCHHYCCFVIL